jgi:hypothetical protein
MADSPIGWLPQVFSQDHPLPETPEAAVTWCFRTSESPTCIFIVDPTTTQQPGASTLGERDVGVSDMFFLEPRTIEL